MKNVSRVFFSVLTGLFLTAAVCTLSSAARNNATYQQGGQQPSAQAQTVSGKIASVDKSSFSINVTSSGSASGSANQEQHLTNSEGSPKTMSFQIDKNTTVDGQLQVGANADVTYRQDGGNNVAISVRVS
jgi:hypothetical protein